MAGSRTLKLSILADVDDLKKKLDTGANEVEGFGGKLEKFSKVAAAAFAAAAAAAAAYAGKLAIEGVKAAIEDEAAQKRLALALENVTGATESQIKAVEAQIAKQSLATGVADDQLRPALQRLATSTGDVKKSQDLLNLALDISAAKGISVETAANALAKAYDGNNGALARLGVGLSTAEIKTLGFEGTVKQLSETFGGAATTQANTFEGQIARLKVAFDEAKESVGAALLPTLQNLLNYFINTVIPKFIEFKNAAIQPVTDAIERNKESLTTLYNIIRNYVVPVLIDGLGDALKFIGKVAGGILDVIGAVVGGIQSAVSTAINAINVLIRAYNAIPLLPNIPTITAPSFGSSSAPRGSSSSSSSVPKITTPSVIPPSTSGGGGGGPAAPSVALSAPTITTTIIPSGNAIPSNFDIARVRMGEQKGDVIINVNSPSIIDREGFSRAVVDALNQSSDRGTGGGGDIRTAQQAL
jgi:phage-related protein